MSHPHAPPLLLTASSPPPLNRHRSRSRRSHRPHVFETAFVSSGLSSTEDLDEVDRIANHPLLQQTARLAAANTDPDEMGGSVDRGVSSAAAFMDRRSASSMTTSPVSWAGGGSRMSRSATLHTMAVTTTADSSGAGSPLDGHHHGWGSSFFPFNRPRAALTRIMRLRKPHSYDNILDEQQPITTTLDYSPRSLRDGPKGTKTMTHRTSWMKTSRSVSNILFHHFHHKEQAAQDDDSSERCHERLTEGGGGVTAPPEFPRNTTAVQLQQQRGKEGCRQQQSPVIVTSRQTSPAGTSAILRTCGSRTGSRTSPGPPGSLGSSDHCQVSELKQTEKISAPLDFAASSLSCDSVCKKTTGGSESPAAGMTGQVLSRGLEASSASCDRKPRDLSADLATSRKTTSSPAGQPASPRASYSSPLLVQARTARSSPLYYLSSPVVRSTSSASNSPLHFSGRVLTPSAAVDSPFFAQKQDMTGSPLYCPRLQGHSQHAGSPFCLKTAPELDRQWTCHSMPGSPSLDSPLKSQKKSAFVSRDSHLSHPREARSSSPPVLLEQSLGELGKPDTSRILSAASRTAVGDGGGKWVSCSSRPLGPLDGRLPTPPSTAPAQKKAIGHPFRFGSPARGFASSEMDVFRLGPGVGRPSRSAETDTGVVAGAGRPLPSSAESTPQKAGQRCRLRPRRRLDLQLRQKRYLREAAHILSILISLRP